jgi:hypothetical protein
MSLKLTGMPRISRADVAEFMCREPPPARK